MKFSIKIFTIFECFDNNFFKKKFLFVAYFWLRGGKIL